MPYMNDPRENAIDIDAHVVWEADNRVEARYPWQAYIVDLCDMSPEEYMKNPIIEAIEGGGGGGTTTKEPTPPEPSGDSLTFYYACVNRNIESSSLTLSDFTKVEVKNNGGFEVEVNMLLGRPTQEDIDYIVANNYSEESVHEVQALRANSFYFVVPDEYANASNMKINVAGIYDIQEEEIVGGFSISGSPEGYSAFKVEDEDNFDMLFVDEPDSYVNYNIKFLTE